MFVTASDKVRRLVAEGDYRQALKIAKGFRLGVSKEESGQMVRAFECYTNADFYRQIGKDPEEEIAEGIRVLTLIFGGGNNVQANS